MPHIRAVILDWAGTTVDYGSRAPTRVFIEIFRRRGIEITAAEARGPMGLAKHEHIAAVARLPRVADEWTRRHGDPPSDSDVQTMYEDFLPLQKETLATHSDVIPGIPAAMDELRRRGIKIGSTTGYTRALMDVVAPIAADQGYSPDAILCSDEVPAGRPAPWMNFRVAELLDVYPLSEVLVVDDTIVGIEAGINAGAVTAGVTQTGNAMGFSADEVASLGAEEVEAKLAEIVQPFRDAGARYILRSVADLPELLDRIGE